jgi:predicted ATP-grasp superfamily ATP-dependent carboligase
MSCVNWVLVTDSGDGQDRASLAAVRALSRAGYRPAVAVAGNASLAGASRHSARWIPVPAVRDPEFSERIRQILDAGSFLTVLPSSDAALFSLGVPVEHLVDKTKLADAAVAAGFRIPPSTVFDSTAALRSAAGRLPFPVVIKPAKKDGHHPHPAYRADRPDQVHDPTEADRAVIAQPFVPERMHAVAGIVRDGKLLAVLHQRYERTWPVDCGTASAAATVEPDAAIERRLPALLQPYEGVFQVQFAGSFLLDVNPRVYGSMPLAVAAGLNLPAMWCRMLEGRPSGTENGVARARVGVRYRWVEGDLRNLARAVRAGRASPLQALMSLAPHHGSAHSTESLEDPGPAIARLRYAVQRARTGAS